MEGKEESGGEEMEGKMKEGEETRREGNVLPQIFLKLALK